jgi:ribosomal protein L30E
MKTHFLRNLTQIQFVAKVANSSCTTHQSNDFEIGGVNNRQFRVLYILQTPPKPKAGKDEKAAAE